MTPTINNSARDITFTFTNSCNCCCGDEDPLVYVNSQGKVEKFDPKKASDERLALQRSISNLKKIIEEKQKESPRHSERIKRSLSGTIDTLEGDSSSKMFYSTVMKVKRVLEHPLYNS